jgi:hypothetical protein
MDVPICRFGQLWRLTVIPLIGTVNDGTNCLSRSENSKIANLTVSVLNSDQYLDFKNYELYSEWMPTIGVGGTWFGTADCIPSYLHNETDGSISIYKE